MSQRAPWFKFYATDYFMDADVDDLPLEAQAILVRMWCICWIEGELPSDIAKLSRKLRIEHLHMQKHMQTLSKFFSSTEHGMLISPRMEKERTHSELVSKVRSHAAKIKNLKQVSAFAGANDTAKDQAKPPAKTVLSDTDTDTDIRTNTKPSAHKVRRSQGYANGSQVCKAAGQSRHDRSHEIIMGWYQDWAGVQCPWDGGEGKQLKAILQAWPDVTDEQFVRCLENLAKSDCIPKGDRPREWLGKLPKFINGPLDQFWKPKGNGNGNGHGKTEASRTETASAVAAGVSDFLRRKNAMGGEHVSLPVKADS
jgi:hypothetical protein